MLLVAVYLFNCIIVVYLWRSKSDLFYLILLPN